MSGVGVLAVGAISAQGRGVEAYDAGAEGEVARTLLREDAELVSGGLTKPRCARAALPPCADRATALLVDALEQVIAELDVIEPAWRRQRVGVCIGTSSGGMRSAERLFAARARGDSISPELAGPATYFAPLDDALEAVSLTPVKRCQVLTACASSTLAIGLGMRWLERGACDLVLAGGYDAVSLFVAAGFEALRATSASLPQPFRLRRDGMLLGEGAAVLALGRPTAPPRFWLTGFGASCDAHHITAPDREGAGLARAARAALGDAGCEPSRVDLVSAHATATPYNDSAEARAIASVCPTGPLVHPFKAQIGHTLGAAGALELLSAAHALEQQLAPAAFGDGEIDPDATVQLLDRSERRSLDVALKLSAAFGGVSAALVVERAPAARSRPPRRPVHLVDHVHVSSYDRGDLAEALDVGRDRLARLDDLGQLSLAALVALRQRVGAEALQGAGVVSGHALATLDTNERFVSRLLSKGARWVDPRLFPATSPNAAAGHGAIALGLTGPNFAVGAGLEGPLEAVAAAAELISAGDAPAMVVVAADDAGPAAQQWIELVAPTRRLARGAVALLLSAEASPAGGRVDPDLPHEIDHLAAGHLALLSWLGQIG